MSNFNLFVFIDQPSERQRIKPDGSRKTFVPIFLQRLLA